MVFVDELIEQMACLWDNTRVLCIEVPLVFVWLQNEGGDLNLSGQQAYLLCNLL